MPANMSVGAAVPRSGLTSSMDRTLGTMRCLHDVLKDIAARVGVPCPPPTTADKTPLQSEAPSISTLQRETCNEAEMCGHLAQQIAEAL